MASAKFFIGQIIHHNRFDYRGVIFSVDPIFRQSEDWYNTMAISKPPKDQPWYRVLVDNAGHTTYVAEKNLEVATETSQINHPFLGRYFSRFDGSRYYLKSKPN